MVIKNKNELIKDNVLRENVLDIVSAGLNSLRAKHIIKNRFKLSGDLLSIYGVLSDYSVDLSKFHNVFLIGFGKGAFDLVKYAENILGNRIKRSAVIDVTKGKLKTGVSFIGDHPLPSRRNIDATKRIMKIFECATKNDLIITFVLGGGSALLCAPTISLKKWRDINNKLIKSGVSIQDINAERKRFSLVKDGGLAAMAGDANVLGLIVSDVPGNDVSVVASAPTVPKSPMKNIKNLLFVSNKTALSAMQEKAELLGYNSVIYSDKLAGEARSIGKRLLKPLSKNKIILAGGETRVTVLGKGKGGRNQEVVLGALKHIQKGQIICSVNSDGRDNCKAAGAIGDFITINKAVSLGLDIKKYLRNNNSFQFFEKVEDLVYTGHRLNVADLIIVAQANK